MTGVVRTAPGPTAPPRTVLLVDAAAGVLRVVRQMFERQGWIVSTAQSGRLGLEAYEREQADLVMLDFDMPDQSVLRRHNKFLAVRQVREASLASLGSARAIREVAQLIELYAGGSAPVPLTVRPGAANGGLRSSSMPPHRAAPRPSSR